MTFLQPGVLLALPFVVLPLVIHLVHQRRFQTVDWAAMRFLLEARALARGHSRLKHWLVMALRMAAVAAVILAVGRPLSRGWLALMGGGRPDTAVVILDRSPSMQLREAGAADTALDTGRRQLAATLETLAAGRNVLVAAPGAAPVDLATPAALADLPSAGPLAAAADLPLLLQATLDHLRATAAGTTDVWICSDQRSNDWAPASGAWSGLRDAFARLPQQPRFHLLSFAAVATGNLAVRVSAARVEPRGAERELLLTVSIARQADGPAASVPVKIEIEGAASTVDVELAGREAVLADHAIRLPAAAAARGFGRVSIPADTDAADNEFFFTFAAPPRRLVIVVADDEAAARPLALAAGIPPDRALEAAVEVVPRGGLAVAPWDSAAALLWQADLPGGRDAEIVAAFLDRGGQVVFFPPDAPTAAEFAGFSWGRWTAHPEPVKPATWRSEDDLLANTRSGAALPVGDVEVRRSCGVAGDHVPLTSLADGGPLVGRVGGGPGGVVFVATTPAARDSTLAQEGVVLYALLQRSIDRGATALAGARQVEAGPAALRILAAAAPGGPWTARAGGADALSSEAGLHAGVFAAADGRLVAVNRPAAEDLARPVADATIDDLFRGLSFTRTDGRAGRPTSLVQEIWRSFLFAMLCALLAEGLLCLPRPAPSAAAPSAPWARPREAA
jgi:hypothetical protein